MISLTANALRGPGKLSLLPLIRASEGRIRELHLGRGLCDNDGISHGGLLTTLLDGTYDHLQQECIQIPSYFQAINILLEKGGISAHLYLNYRAPTMVE